MIPVAISWNEGPIRTYGQCSGNTNAVQTWAPFCCCSIAVRHGTCDTIFQTPGHPGRSHCLMTPMACAYTK